MQVGTTWAKGKLDINGIARHIDGRGILSSQEFSIGAGRKSSLEVFLTIVTNHIHLSTRCPLRLMFSYSMRDSQRLD